MKDSIVPSRIPRVEGDWRASWYLPFPPPLTHSWREDIRFMIKQYADPAVRAFYTPARHQVTNVRECVRLFGHLTRAVRIYQEDFLQMAKTNERVASVRWNNLRLTEDDKQNIQDEPLDIDVVISDFMAMVYLGYRLSVTYDEYSKAMQASLVCVDKDSDDNGWGISARHPDLDWCLRSLLYKAQLIGTGHWAQTADSPTPDSWS